MQKHGKNISKKIDRVFRDNGSRKKQQKEGNTDTHGAKQRYPTKTHSLQSARSEGLWKARESMARAVLWSTFTPSKKNMSHTLRTDGQGRVLATTPETKRERRPLVYSCDSHMIWGPTLTSLPTNHNHASVLHTIVCKH